MVLGFPWPLCGIPMTSWYSCLNDKWLSLKTKIRQHKHKAGKIHSGSQSCSISLGSETVQACPSCQSCPDLQHLAPTCPPPYRPSPNLPKQEPSNSKEKAYQFGALSLGIAGMAGLGTCTSGHACYYWSTFWASLSRCDRWFNSENPVNQPLRPSVSQSVRQLSFFRFWVA